MVVKVVKGYVSLNRECYKMGDEFNLDDKDANKLIKLGVVSPVAKSLVVEEVEDIPETEEVEDIPETEEVADDVLPTPDPVAAVETNGRKTKGRTGNKAGKK